MSPLKIYVSFLYKRNYSVLKWCVRSWPVKRFLNVNVALRWTNLETPDQVRRCFYINIPLICWCKNCPELFGSFAFKILHLLHIFKAAVLNTYPKTFKYIFVKILFFFNIFTKIFFSSSSHCGKVIHRVFHLKNVKWSYLKHSCWTIKTVVLKLFLFLWKSGFREKISFQTDFYNPV